MTPLAAGLLVGLPAGFLAGLFGIGGGAVMIPLLAVVLGLPQKQAQGVTLVVLLLPLGLPALWTYLKRGVRLHLGLVACLVLAFLPGAWAGAKAAQALPDLLLKGVFGTFLVLVALRLWRTPSAQDGADPAGRPLSAPWRGLVIGTAAGLVSGLLGIGGGLVMIPLLMTWDRRTQLEAQATSLAVMLMPIGLPAVWVYARGADGLPWVLAAGLACGFAFGSIAGARLANHLHPERLRKGFALFLGVMAASLLLRAR